MATDMATMKPDQERVKNLLLDTVTLLCKNSLQYENHLRVEGLLGVAVDDNDVFFLHISEKFQSDAYLERLAAEAEAQREKEEAEKERERKLAEAERAEQERTSQNQSPSQVSPAQDSSETTDLSAVKIKKEANDSASDDEDVMITGSTLNSPHSVAHPVSMVAGQRRAQRRPHSPSGFRGSFNQSQTTGETDYEDDSFTGDVPANSGYSHLDNSASFKEEGEWDEPPSKRPAGMSHPWPNLTGIGDIAAHAAHTTFQDSGESQLSGGDLSQPGCSTWQGPSGITGGQDSQSSLKHFFGALDVVLAKVHYAMQSPTDSNIGVALTMLVSIIREAEESEGLPPMPGLLAELYEYKDELHDKLTLLSTVVIPEADNYIKKEPVSPEELHVTDSQLEALLSLNFSASKIAKLFGVFDAAVRRRLKYSGIKISNKYTMMSDDALDKKVMELLSESQQRLGYRSVLSKFKSQGILIQETRVRESLSRINGRRQYCATDSDRNT